MGDGVRRRFQLIDGMILVAATALGFAYVHSNRATWYLWYMTQPGSHAFNAGKWMGIGLLFAIPVTLTWTLALLAIRLRTPRPPLRRLTRQPGFVACLAAVLSLALSCLTLIPSLVSAKVRPNAAEYFLLNFTAEPAFAVFGVWLALALSGRWRGEPGWVDRTGVFLGLSWFGANALNALRIALLSW